MVIKKNIKVCLNCNKEFSLYKKVNSGHKPSKNRPSNSVTCSSKCSKEYWRKQSIERYYIRKKKFKEEVKGYKKYY